MITGPLETLKEFFAPVTKLGNSLVSKLTSSVTTWVKEKAVP